MAEIIDVSLTVDASSGTVIQDLRICRGYTIGGRVLSHLTPGPARDLEYQERLTRMLLRARPVYHDPGDDWPAVIEHETGAPVTLRSYGPTARDKETAREPATSVPLGWRA